MSNISPSIKSENNGTEYFLPSTYGISILTGDAIATFL